MPATSSSTNKQSKPRVVVPIEGSWTAIPNDLLRDTSLSPLERMLGTLLYMYAGNSGRAFPGQEDMAALLGVQRRTVQLALNSLKAHGYVVARRTIYGNVYVLQEPKKILTNAILDSHAHAICDSHAHAICDSPHANHRSHASINDQTHDQDSTTTESSDANLESEAQHVTNEDEGRNAHTQKEESNRIQELLRSVGIAAYKKLAKQLKGIPYAVIQERVEQLVQAGKEPGIIYNNLLQTPFTSDTLQPFPGNIERSKWLAMGVDVSDPLADDDISDDDIAAALEALEADRASRKTQQALERGDPVLAEFYKEAGV